MYGRDKTHLNQKVIWLVTALILVSIPLLFSACASAKTGPEFTGGPRLSFTTETAYLGVATPNQTMDYTFHLKNIGNAPLLLGTGEARAVEGC
ncbi:MAG: hypothetical protein ACW97O_09790 [Candidatus Thorarchaeota archaeon]|jgi:hypothetical protein